MGSIFQQDLHDEYGSWPLAYIRTGAVELGEVRAVAEAVADGDDGAFCAQWVALGDRLAEGARAALGAGRRATAHMLFLKAASAYGAAYHPLYGEPVDPRLLHAFRQQMASFEQAMATRPFPLAPLRIPFEGAAMPAWLIPAAGHEAARRPLIIFTNGYDATVTDLYFASAAEAAQRGYHCLVFDGPGQGEMLYEHGIRLRPDWETVVGAVVDFALTLPQVDGTRIALCGWSLGGYLAPRAASGEPRIAACIADPGQWSIAAGFTEMALRQGVPPDQAARLSEADDALLERIEAFLRANRKFRWSVMQRGYWVNGTPDFRSYLRSVETFTMDGRVDSIRCPTLMSLAEDDPLTGGTERFFERLTCPKTLLRFTGAEGAGMHCETYNRALFIHRTLDWLDELFAVHG